MSPSWQNTVTASMLCLLLALLPGCGPRYDVAETVEGTLTRNGQPVPGAHVEFVPEADPQAPHSSAVSDDKGFFRLTRNDNQQAGAVVGPHRVLLFPGRAGSGRDREEVATSKALPAGTVIPSPYMNFEKTPLKVEVKKDQTTYDLQIKSGFGR
jgi:hypothetical protein